MTGEAAPEPARFPLLIKFLYPRQKLSVQVHPDDAGARRVGQACGKTECWYVARAVEGAQVGLGLRPGINREMFRLAIEANQAEHMLNWLDVRAGEMIYVDAGTVHAVGPGSTSLRRSRTATSPIACTITDARANFTWIAAWLRSARRPCAGWVEVTPHAVDRPRGAAFLAVLPRGKVQGRSAR